MGTLLEAMLLGEDEEHLAATAEAVLDEIARVERLLSRFDPRSEVARINRCSVREPVQVDVEMASVLETCFAAWRWTGGAFDITLGGGRAYGLPDRDELPAGVVFDRGLRTIRLRAPGVTLDFGGFGKGYALDRVAEILTEFGIEHALVHGGGSSVLARGRDLGGQPWRIALQHPITGQAVRTIELADAALSCSATNEQADIVDPGSGLPVREGVGCAVIAPSAADAEVLSTALVCLGRERGERLVAQRKNCVVYWTGSEAIAGNPLRAASCP